MTNDSQPQHSGAKRLREGNTTPQTPERPPVADYEMDERAHPHLPHDVFYMDEEALAERGMKGAVYACVADLVYPPGHPQQGEYVFPGDRVIVSVTPPAVADRIGPDILTKKRMARKSFQLAKDEEGNLIPSTEDQVFATYDRHEYLNKGTRSTAFHNDQCKKFYEGMKNRRIVDKSQFGPDQHEQAKEQAHNWMRGISSQRFPASMSLQDIEAAEGPDKIRDMERKYARGNRSVRAGEYDQWEEKIAKTQEKVSKNRTVSFPGSNTK